MKTNKNSNTAMKMIRTSILIILSTASALSQTYPFGDGSENVKLLGAPPSGGDFNIGQTSGAGKINFVSKEGAKLLTILNNGFVGIGIANPQKPLVVNGVTQFFSPYNGSNFLHFDFASNGNKVRSYGTNLFLESRNSTEDIEFRTDNSLTSLMTVKGTGNVGIGTTTPVDLLHLRKSVSDVTLHLTNDNTGHLASDGAEFNLQESTSNIVINNRELAGIDFRTNSSQRMIITAAGNVGIGTATPDVKLDINGAARLGSDNDTGLSISRFTSGLTDVPGSQGGILFKGPIHSHVVFDIHANDQNDGFYVRIPDAYQVNPSVNKTAFAVKATGNVGIGTTNPSQRLEVNGTVYSREVKVDIQAGTGPDYVFEEDYPLASIEEIEAFIQSEKHLPGVPSAAEMEANGVKLGEMNMLLLKKIEELTLYTIEQEKQLKKVSHFEEENATLKAGYMELLKRVEKLEEK